jgi:aryl-alcohol dehydrogenase-like predicted oxidoreductase
MYSGLLGGAMTSERIAQLPENDWRKSNPNFKEPLLSRNLRLVQTLRYIGNRHNASPGEVAIAWTLPNPAVTAQSLAFVPLNKYGELRPPPGSASTRWILRKSKTL